MQIAFSLVLTPRLAAAVLLLGVAGVITLLNGPWVLYGMLAAVILLAETSPRRGS